MWTLSEAYISAGVSPDDITDYDCLCPCCNLGNCFVPLTNGRSICRECGRILNHYERKTARLRLLLEDAELALMMIADDCGQFKISWR